MITSLNTLKNSINSDETKLAAGLVIQVEQWAESEEILLE